jgi:predicted lipoprotein with Yx(FWY)xxD motif
MRKSLVVLAPLVLLVAACGGSGTSSSSTTAPKSAAENSVVQITTRTLPGVGTVLVNSQGRTLYVYAPDSVKKVTCTGRCASDWPPLAISAGQKPETGGEVRSSLVSTDPNPAGGQVVTYAGWPLYLDVDDHSPGTAVGQATYDDGGMWYVISPAGKVIRKMASPRASSSS